MQSVDGIQYLPVVNRSEHFQQEVKGQFSLGKIGGVVSFADESQQTVVQMPDEFRLASEYGQSVERIIPDQPFIQVVPIGRQVHFGVFPGLGMYQPADGRTVKQCRHALQFPVISGLVNETHGNLGPFLHHLYKETVFIPKSGRRFRECGHIYLEVHFLVVRLPQQTVQCIFLFQAKLRCTGNEKCMDGGGLCQQPPGFFGRIESPARPFRFRESVSEEEKQVVPAGDGTLFRITRRMCLKWRQCP